MSLSKLKDSKQPEVIYLRVDHQTKTWLKSLCKKQLVKVSMSTMGLRILKAAQKDSELVKAALQGVV